MKTGTIKNMRIREDRGEMLREKSMELTIKAKAHIKEVDIVNFLIDEFAEHVDFDGVAFHCNNVSYELDDAFNRHKEAKTEMDKKQRNWPNSQK